MNVGIARGSDREPPIADSMSVIETNGQERNVK